MMTETGSILDQFLQDHRFRLTDRTLQKYKVTIQAFFKAVPKDFQAIRSSDVREWLSQLQEAGQKPTTINHKLTVLRIFYAYIVEERLLAKNPAIRVNFLQEEDHIPHYLTMDQLGELRELTKDSPRERAMIETFYSTGMRRSELVDILKADILWDRNAIVIREGKDKKERLVFFSQDCRARLQMYLDERQSDLPHLFLNSKGRPLQPRTLSLMFERYAEQLGFNVTAHTLRHTFAAHLAQKGMPLAHIQDLLGHDNLETTQVYARLYEQARKDIYNDFQ